MFHLFLSSVSSVLTMSSSISTSAGKVNRWTRNATERRREQYYYEALAFSRHNINLVFDEENMKPDRHTKAPENAGIDPSTMRVSTWYQESTHEDDDPLSPPPNRERDTFTGVHWASYQVRRPIEDDGKRLEMEKDDMLPPLPQRLANSENSEDQALQKFYSNSDEMHRATSDDACTQAWFDSRRSSFPQSVRETGTNVELFIVSTYQCSICLQQYGFLSPKG